MVRMLRKKAGDSDVFDVQKCSCEIACNAVINYKDEGCVMHSDNAIK